MQEITKSKLLCQSHPENYLQVLNLGEKSQGRSRLLCVQCLIDSQNKGENLNRLVNVNQFLNDPQLSVYKIITNEKSLSHILDEINVQLTLNEETIKISLIKIRDNLNYLRSQQGEIAEELHKELKLNDVVQMLRQMDEQEKLENQINSITLNLNEAQFSLFEKFKNNQKETLNSLQVNLNLLLEKSELFLKQSRNQVMEIVDTQVFDELAEFPDIHWLISQGRKIEYELIYQGSRDGLNGQAYWAKCNLQQNLLTIMTSENGNKFGGYSPCLLNHEIHNFAQDPTMKSFIFQYNKKEIYKLKNKEHAVYCQLNHGPTFGYGGDIYIAEDFQNGHTSYLGKTYDTSGYNIIDSTLHVFGAKSPQLEECKVYKVIVKK